MKEATWTSERKRCERCYVIFSQHLLTPYCPECRAEWAEQYGTTPESYQKAVAPPGAQVEGASDEIPPASDWGRGDCGHCYHPRGWHRKSQGACLECGCLEYRDDRVSRALQRVDERDTVKKESDPWT